MRTFFLSKKFLLIALLEDTVLIFFLFTLLASSLEILLPGVLAHKIPLAFLFTFFAGTILLSTRSLHKESLSYPAFSLPQPMLFFLLLLLGVVALFMTRAFGIWGALIQVFLLALAFFLWLTKKEPL